VEDFFIIDYYTGQVTISAPLYTGMHFIILVLMKKLSFILLISAATATAQVSPQQADSTLHPARTDSADFSNSAYKNDTTKVPAGNQPTRRDSLPVDDRKPKTQGKK
jgi:hypothetical protein